MFNEVYLSIKTDSNVTTMCKCPIEGSPTEIIATINEPIDKYTVNQVSKAFKPVVKGEWVKTGLIDKVACSNCKSQLWDIAREELLNYKYCPSCGAEMEVQK